MRQTMTCHTQCRDLILFRPNVHMRADRPDSLVFHREPTLWSPTGHAAGERSEIEGQHFNSSLSARSKNSEEIFVCMTTYMSFSSLMTYS